MSRFNFSSTRFLALAGLLAAVNMGGWIWVRHDLLQDRRAPVPPSTPSDQAETDRPASRPLTLVRIEQAALATNRLLTLACRFDGCVDWRSFSSRLKVSLGGKPVAWRFLDEPRANQCRVRTETPIPGDRITVVLEPGVASTDSRFSPVAERIEALLAVTPEFRFSQAESETPSFGQPEIHLSFTQPVDMQDAPARIACEPSVPFSVVPRKWRDDGLTVRGDFEAGRAYTFILDPNLRSNDGHRLEAEVRRTVRIRHRQPAVRIDVPGRYLAPEGAGVVPVLTVNTPRIVSSLIPVLPQNLVQFAMREAEQYSGWQGGRWDEGSSAEALTGEGRSRTNCLTAARNAETRLDLRLRDYLAGEPLRGVYLLTLQAEEAAPVRRLICISDIGLGVRAQSDAWQVWTTFLRAGCRAPGLEVSLYGRNNALIDTAITDASGLAAVAFNPGVDQPFLVVVSNPADDDMTFLALTDATAVDQPVSATRGYLAATACEAFLFTGRDLYRHGEKAFVQGLLRRGDGQAPAPFPVVLRVLRPDGRCFSQTALMPDALGAFTTEVVFPDFLPSGTYDLQLTLPGENGAELGSQAVMLEAFVPPQIRVGLRDCPAVVGPGQALACTLAAAHLFGKPAAGLKAELSVVCRPVDFAPPAWEGYRFGDAERRPTLPTLLAPRLTLADDGTAQFAVTLPPTLRPAARLEAWVEGTVFEMGGRSVTAREPVTVDPYPFYIGVLPPERTIIRPGSPVTFHWSAVRPDGGRATNAVDLTVAVEQLSWVGNLRREPDGSFVWASETIRSPIFTETVSATGATVNAFTFVAPNAGDYEIVFTDPVSQAATRCAFTAGDESQTQASRDRSRPDRVEILFDRESYAPGDVAVMQIRAPFAGEAWVTLQRDTILESRVLTLHANTAEVRWPITEDLAPNAEVAVSVIRPAVAENPWSAHRAWGLAPLRVHPPARRLAVSVKPPAALWRPLDPLPVRVRICDAAGRAVTNGALTLLAVDEGICLLTDYQTPDPAAFFLETRAGWLPFHDLFRQLMPITADDTLQGTASHTGGDGPTEMLKRLNPIAARRFKPVMLWNANLPLDPSGETEVTLALPEFTGELRLMAIAWDAAATGSGQASIKIRRRLVVQPDLPRFLAPRDRANLTLSLHNTSSNACDATLQVRTTGPLQASDRQQKLALRADESRTLMLPVKAANEVGAAGLTVVVEGAGERYEETLELAVRPALAWETTTGHVRIEPGVAHVFAPPSNAIPASVSQIFVCAQRPSINLLGALEFVTEYPHGCLEQTVSSALPLLTLQHQPEPIVPPSSTLAREVPARINAALTRVLAMQRFDGFAIWPDIGETDDFCSVYAAHFLVEAAAAGYPVSPAVLAALPAMLDRLDWEAPDALRAYAAMVRALGGHPDFAAMSKLLEREGSLSAEAQFLLGRALIRAGEVDSGRRVIVSAGIPHDLRAAAFGVLAWLEIDPAAPQTAACCREIQRHRRAVGHWATTQDNALALLALGGYAGHAVSAPAPIFPCFQWDGGTLAAGPTNIVTWEPGAQLALQSLVLTNAGAGPIYVSRRISAVPDAGTRTDVDAGMKVRREWLDRDGEPIDAARLARGDLIIVRITLDVPGEGESSIVIEDLLPACLEIENGDLAGGGMLPWIDPREGAWVLHREVRDDRLLLFTHGKVRQNRCHYAARVVSAGEFAVPPIAASDMYAPERLSRHGGGRVTVTAP